MLVLSRQRDESIMIGDNIKVTVTDLRGDKVRLGISAPRDMPVHREEVYRSIKRQGGGEVPQPFESDLEEVAKLLKASPSANGALYSAIKVEGGWAVFGAQEDSIADFDEEADARLFAALLNTKAKKVVGGERCIA